MSCGDFQEARRKGESKGAWSQAGAAPKGRMATGSLDRRRAGCQGLVYG